MNTEVIQSNNETMTSVEIAEVTCKRHKDVLKAIRNMESAWNKISGRNFALASYKDEQGKERPCYHLNKRECLYVATKFNDEARARLVIRWEELENKAKTSVMSLPNFSNPAEAARAWAEQFEQKMLANQRAEIAEQQILSLTSEIESMQQKVSYYDMILANKSTVVITQIAQDYGMSAVKFNQTLYDLHIQHKVNNQWILYAEHLGQGYVQSKPVTITHTGGYQSVKYNTEWTQKGRIFLYEELKKNNIIPLIEK